MSATRDSIAQSAFARVDRMLRLARAHVTSAEEMRDGSLDLHAATEHLSSARMLVGDLEALHAQLAILTAPQA